MKHIEQKLFWTAFHLPWIYILKLYTYIYYDTFYVIHIVRDYGYMKNGVSYTSWHSVVIVLSGHCCCSTLEAFWVSLLVKISTIGFSTMRSLNFLYSIFYVTRCPIFCFLFVFPFSSTRWWSWELASTLKEAKGRFDAAGVKLIAVGVGTPNKAGILAERVITCPPSF